MAVVIWQEELRIKTFVSGVTMKNIIKVPN